MLFHTFVCDFSLEKETAEHFVLLQLLTITIDIDLFYIYDA